MQYTSCLAQDVTQNGVLKTIYTVPASKKSHISRVFFCNTDVAQKLISVSIARKWAADSISQYIYYNLAIPSNDTFLSSVDIWLEAWDEIRVNANTSLISVNVFGKDSFDNKGE